MYNNIVRQREKPKAIQTTYSQARQNLAKLLDEVALNRETVVIKRRRATITRADPSCPAI